jgi:hypothetical protein
MEPDPLLGTPADERFERSVQADQCFVKIAPAIRRAAHLDFRQDRDAMPPVGLEVDRQRHERCTAGAAQSGPADRGERRPAEERNHETAATGVLIAQNPEDAAPLEHTNDLQQARIPVERPHAASRTPAGHEPLEVRIPQRPRHDVDRVPAQSVVGSQQLPVADVTGRRHDAAPAAEGIEKMLLAVDGNEILQRAWIETREPQKVDRVASQRADTLSPHFQGPRQLIDARVP